MTSHDDEGGAHLLREAYRAFKERDRETILSLIAEDAKWHVFGESSLAGTVEGREAVWERFFAPMWDTQTLPEIHDILESDDHVVALGEVAFDLPDGERRFKSVEVYHYADGQLTERWFFTDRRAELDEVLDRITGAAAGS
jgi:ketosteroid isomerase-like protein